MVIPITYIRSSSYAAWDFCPHKFYIDYILGYHSPANKKAEKGTIVHKALELLAQVKMAQQEDKTIFYNAELQAEFNTNLTPIAAITVAYHHYISRGDYTYTQSDFDDCKSWLNMALEFNSGMFDPRNLDIISPEKYFDISIDQPWGYYDYELAGKKVSGYLRLKGTLDLITRRSEKVIELIDWKTGASMLNWATGKEKDWNSLHDDPQMRIYHYAASKLYPHIDEIFVTVFYIRAGGPFTLCLQRSDLAETEKMIQHRFELIKNTVRPKLIYPDWKCNKLCHFYKNDINNISSANYECSACKTIQNEITKLGIEKVTAVRTKDATFSKYGEGGGSTHKE